MTSPRPIRPPLTRVYRANQKILHLTLHGIAVILVVLAVVAAVVSHTAKLPAPIPNLYSVHSWMGTATLALLATQVSPPPFPQRNVPTGSSTRPSSQIPTATLALPPRLASNSLLAATSHSPAW